LKEINVCHLTQFFFIIKLDNGNGSSFAAAAAAWQWQQRWQRCGGNGGGNSLVATRWWRWQHSSGGRIPVAAVWWQQRGGMVAAAAAQWRRWRGQSGAVAAWHHDGGDMRMRCYKVFVVEVQNMYLWNMLHMIVCKEISNFDIT
jgi:hypothetical protein